MTSRADQFAALKQHLNGLEHAVARYANAEQRGDEEGMRMRASDYLVHVDAIQRLYQRLYGHLKLDGYVIEVKHPAGREPGWTAIVIQSPSLHWAPCPQGQEPTVVQSWLVADWLASHIGSDRDHLRVRTRSATPHLQPSQEAACLHKSA
jgi:hypothetical protein